MKRIHRPVTTLFPVIGFLVCCRPSGALGSLIEGGGSGAIEPLAPMTLKVNSPALPSGVALSGLEAPQLTVLPEIGLPAAALPSYSGATAQLPGAARAAIAQAAHGANGAVLGAALKLDAARTGADGKPASDSAVSGAAEATFDGAKAQGPEAGPAFGGGGSFDGGDGGSGNGGGSNDGGDNHNQPPLDKVYPKVVVVLDTFKGPASEATVSYVEKLADLGVHVVFVTPRPEKGEDSAESVLTSKLRTRAGNPVMVVSYNGARITMHKATRAENPKGAVGDSEGFAPSTLELFEAVSAEAKARYKLSGAPVEIKKGVEDNTYIYGVEFKLSGKLSKARRTAMISDVVRFYNDKAASAGLTYRFEASEGADGRVSLYTQSTALRLNTGRIFAAIAAQYPDLRDRLKQEDVLFLADSTRAARFLSTLPGKDQIPGQGYFIHGVTDEAELQQGLFAVLHGKGLDEVKVTRNQLRSYISWLEARQRYGSPRGGGGFRMEPSLGRYQQEAKFYLAIIHYHLMAELYHRIRNHNFDGASLSSALQLLDDMAKNPKAFGVNIDEDMTAMRGNRKWKPFERDRLGVIRQWLANYYERNFPNYPRGVSENVVGTMINLSRDSGTNIKLYYESPMTKRRYQVGVLPARGQVEKDDHGYMLVVHAYRTGKEMRQDDFEEALEVNLAMRAMLQGYAKKEADGRWTVNGEPARVMAVYHTMTRDMPSAIMTPEQVEARSGEVTALIEKMLADKEFLAYWEAEQEKNKKVAVGQATHKAKTAARQAARPPKKGTQKPS